MSETRPETAIFIDTEALTRLGKTYEGMLSNLKTLQEILVAPDVADRRIQIEARSLIFDLGGFFMDETASDPRYRDGLFVGPNNCDAIRGTAECLVSRLFNDRSEYQLQVNMVTKTGPAIGYFRLEQTLGGCLITQPPAEFASN
jgi:hypothetical protein